MEQVVLFCDSVKLLPAQHEREIGFEYYLVDRPTITLSGYLNPLPSPIPTMSAATIAAPSASFHWYLEEKK